MANANGRRKKPLVIHDRARRRWARAYRTTKLVVAELLVAPDVATLVTWYVPSSTPGDRRA